MFNRIFLFDGGSFESLAATALRFVSTRWDPLDVSSMTDRNHHRFFGDQIIHIDITELNI